jgi:alkanesulfonate monooxygenase SsuD/methylene tetrahydromethanopterin reductase-like flavin-dependent oxidoreductase (luciferase family)
MKLGLGPIPLQDISRHELEELAHAAVAASFDAVWVSESRDAGAGGGLAAAAMLAQLVPIRTGAVLDFGGYHPLHAAEDIAVADLSSGGRIEVMLHGGSEEQARLLVDALSGAHIQFEGAHLRVPARLDANQPAPSHLALNPRPAQPAVPIWIDGDEAEAAERLGVGVAAGWSEGAAAPRPLGRWPGMLLCPADVRAEDLLRAVGGRAAYFLVAARDPSEVAAAGRRLGGPLRMPEFPEWINQA